MRKSRADVGIGVSGMYLDRLFADGYAVKSLVTEEIP
jgi:hypothetical protein